jgi:DNA-binding NarL/FixJ family response regulator
MRANGDSSGQEHLQRQIDQLQVAIDQLREALAQRSNGHVQPGPQHHLHIDERLFHMAPFSSLTQRERQVLIAYIASRDSKAVAGELGSKLQTVKNQLVSIRDKLGVECREDLIVFVLTAGQRADAEA